MMLIEPMIELGAQDVHREDAGVHRRAHLQRQRRVERPAGGRRAAGHEERADQHERRRDQQPEAEVVHARERHVGRADLQRDHPVREADEGRHDRAEHHDQAVHGGELVEQLRVDELQAGLEQLGADQQRQHAADHQHGEREQQVQRADVLVVGREHPAAPAVRARGRACSSWAWSWPWRGRGLRSWWTSSCDSSSVVGLLARWPATSAGCTIWPVLFDQLFLV